MLNNVHNHQSCGQEVGFPVRFTNLCLKCNVSLTQPKGYFAQFKRSKGLSNKLCKAVPLEWLPQLYFKRTPLMSVFHSFNPSLLFCSLKPSSISTETSTERHKEPSASLSIRGHLFFVRQAYVTRLGLGPPRTLHVVRTLHLLVTCCLAVLQARNILPWNQPRLLRLVQAEPIGTQISVSTLSPDSLSAFLTTSTIFNSSAIQGLPPNHQHLTKFKCQIIIPIFIVK